MTSCHDCKYAIWENGVQEGCQLNKIDIYESRGVEVETVWDDNGVYYILPDAVCHFKNADPNDVHLSYLTIIFTNGSISDLKTTLLSLKAQRPEPDEVVIIRQIGDGIEPLEYRNVVNELHFHSWELRNSASPDFTKGQLVDLAVDFVPNFIYTVYEAGFSIPVDTYSWLEDQILYNKFPCLALTENSTGNGFTSFVHLHRSFGGNAEIPYIDKLREKIGCPTLIQPIQNIVPNFPE
jgi:hypothetical protein